MADQHTVTIDGVKYDYNQAMNDPVLKARYTYLADDPKGVTLQGVMKAYEQAKSLPGFSQKDTDEYNDFLAKYNMRQESYSPEAKSPIQAGDVSISPYDINNRDQYPGFVNKEAEAAEAADPRRYTVPTPTNSSVITSDAARDQTQYNQGVLGAYESGLPKYGSSSYTGPSIVDYLASIGQATDINSRAKLAQQLGIPYDVKAIGDASAKQNTALLNAMRGNSATANGGPLQISSANPAVSSLVTQINSLTSQLIQRGETLSPENQALIDRINNIQGQQTGLIAGARTQDNRGDTKGLNDNTSKIEQLEDEKNKEIQKLFDSIAPLRKKLEGLMGPSADEKSAQEKLDVLYDQAKKDFNLTADQTIPMGNITGQQTSKARIYAQVEANLLTKLGRAQEARKIEKEILEGRITGIKDDVELMNSISDQIMEEEDHIIDRASKLSSEKRETIAMIAERFASIDLDDPENAEVKSEIQRIALEQGIDADLALAAARSAYKQQLFDNSIKSSQEARLRGDGNNGIDLSTDEKNIVQAIGAEDLPIDIQNTLVNAMTATERKAFMADYNQASQTQSIDPYTYLENWARRWDAKIKDDPATASYDWISGLKQAGWSREQIESEYELSEYDTQALDEIYGEQDSKFLGLF